MPILSCCLCCVLLRLMLACSQHVPRKRPTTTTSQVDTFLTKTCCFFTARLSAPSETHINRTHGKARSTANEDCWEHSDRLLLPSHWSLNHKLANRNAVFVTAAGLLPTTLPWTLGTEEWNPHVASHETFFVWKLVVFLLFARWLWHG